MKVEKFDDEQLTLLSKSILDKEIKNLTVDFDDETFLYFNNNQMGKVNVVEGYQGDFAEVQYSVKNNLLFKEDEPAPAPEDKKLNSQEKTSTDLIATLHKSLFPSLDNLVTNFTNVEAYLQPYEDPGGDFLWYKNYDEGKCLVILGDCTGHGVQGAMIAMSVVTLLKQTFHNTPENLLDTVYQFYDSMANLLEDDNRGGFDSQMGFLLYDLDNHSVEYTGNGINMIHRCTDGSVHVHNTRYTQLFKRKLILHSIVLEQGDQMLIYTDGITDQYNSNNTRKLGRKNLRDIVYSLDHKDTLQDFLNKFDDFRGDVQQMDDQSMLIITY